MITRTAVSTISYNTDHFLIEKLNEKVSLGEIEFFCFINHLPEEDEKKAHKHLFLIPSSTVDTFSLQKFFLEIDITNPDLPPLGCIMFKHSKFSDWYMYALHDKDYLASKCMERKYHYSKDDIFCSSVDYMNELIHTSDFSKFKSFAKFRDAVNADVSFRDLFNNGFIPVQQIIQWRKAYNLLKFNDMDYNDNSNCRKRSYVDENGEIIDF